MKSKVIFLQTIFLGADLANMKKISKFNEELCFLLSVIDMFSKYAWVLPFGR